MEKFICRLAMMIMGVALAVWLVITIVSPLLQQAKNVSKAFGG